MSGGILGSNEIMWGMYKLMGCFRDGPKEEEGGVVWIREERGGDACCRSVHFSG